MATQANKRPTERQQFSQPQLTRMVTLKTGIAQNAYNRVAHRFNQSLFNLDVIMRISFSDKEMMDALTEQIDTEFKASNEALDIAIEQIKVAAKDAGIDPDNTANLPSYSNVQTFEVNMRTPTYAQFLKILSKLDYLTMLLEMMWLNGEVTSQFRLSKSKEWQSMTIRLANKIIARERNARSAAEKKGDKEAIDQETMDQTEDINENEDVQASTKSERNNADQETNTGSGKKLETTAAA